MDGNRNNGLWEKRRFFLPVMRKIATHRCKDCAFFILVQGRAEVRRACVVSIKAYGDREKRIPSILPVMDVIKRVGTEGLAYCLKFNDPEAQSCAKFELKT